jgi:hypothetical protein
VSLPLHRQIIHAMMAPTNWLAELATHDMSNCVYIMWLSSELLVLVLSKAYVAQQPTPPRQRNTVSTLPSETLASQIVTVLTVSCMGCNACKRCICAANNSHNTLSRVLVNSQPLPVSQPADCRLQQQPSPHIGQSLGS